LKALQTAPKSALELADQAAHRTIDLMIAAAQFLDAAHRVDHRRMIAAAELAPDLGQRARGQALGEVHRDLARTGDHHGAPRGDQIDRLEVVMRRHCALDLVDRDSLGAAAQHIAERRLGELQVDLLAGQLGISDQAIERAFDFAQAAGDLVREQLEHLFG